MLLVQIACPWAISRVYVCFTTGYGVEKLTGREGVCMFRGWGIDGIGHGGGYRRP
jgi:hypothetical protein